MISISKQSESFLLRYLSPELISVWKKSVGMDVKVFIKPLTLSKTRLGYYQFNHLYHLIGMETTLPPYKFILTLFHETAHLAVLLDGKKVKAPHGHEWQAHFLRITKYIRDTKLLPDEIADAYIKHASSGRASSVLDTELEKVLEKYNSDPEHKVYAKELKVGTVFRVDNMQVTVVKVDPYYIYVMEEKGPMKRIDADRFLYRKNIISVPEVITVDSLPIGSRFELNGFTFTKGKKLRTFYECVRESDKINCRVRGVAACRPLD